MNYWQLVVPTHYPDIKLGAEKNYIRGQELSDIPALNTCCRARRTWRWERGSPPCQGGPMEGQFLFQWGQWRGQPRAPLWTPLWWRRPTPGREAGPGWLSEAGPAGSCWYRWACPGLCRNTSCGWSQSCLPPSCTASSSSREWERGSHRRVWPPGDLPWCWNT